ncbi:OmcA/MtrC family decaheme c-type cytochrome [Ferrimonas sp. SCSIO 43195]|uniref:OmcA/MtrC family decaheme c-type cytochrome n=1 Tax=Ferrimonas sp. SCSIO 43195 TaxID=2822844 RepID=UPI002076209C|nr:OmcA/MtrC family decaheme c-type cytochrome [Ferrimonas sp. SCSIO 43195]USD36404.1 OmcA/MtrC family decaheme c-type cytochrome [Ferrimonas sp. SCSIO 43195]
MMMMNKPNWRLLATAAVVSAALTACGGDDGNDGNSGEDGRPGGEPATSVSTLNLKVTDASFNNGLPVFTLLATNEDDEAVVGLQGLKVNVAQLLPAGHQVVGDPTKWQFAGDDSRNGAAEIVDQKNGYYTVTFTSLDKAQLDPNFTRRLNIVSPAGTLIDGTTEVPNGQASFDYNAAGAAADYTRNIVATDSCAACHGEGNGIHHSNYIEPETCATCHDGLKAEGGRTSRSFAVLVHDVHKVAAEKDENGKSEYPTELSSCNVCHETSAPAEELAITEWGNWSAVPSKENCASCHADNNHIMEQADSSRCASCHTAEGTGVVKGTIDAHLGEWNDAAEVISQWGSDVEMAYFADTDTTTVTVSITDANGQKLAADQVLPQIKRLEVLTNLGPNYPVLSYYTGSHLDAVSNGELANNTTIVDGNFVLPITGLPYGAEGTDADTAFSFVGLAACSKGNAIVACADVADPDNTDNYTGMKANMAFVTKSGFAPSKRHTDSLEFSKCEGCHNDNWQIHKGHHSGFVMTEQVAHDEEGKVIGLDGCVTCHTPDGTYAPTKNGAWEQKLHVVHGDKNIINDCTQCHTSFNLNAFAKKGAINTGVTVDGNAGYGTPITATCASCHSYPSAIDHMTGETFGNGKFNLDKADAQLAVSAENCFVCHAPDVADHSNVKF